MLRLLSLVVLVAATCGFDLLGDEMIELLNKQPNMTWTAGRNFAVRPYCSCLFIFVAEVSVISVLLSTWPLSYANRHDRASYLLSYL